MITYERLESVAVKDLRPGDYLSYYGYVETVKPDTVIGGGLTPREPMWVSISPLLNGRIKDIQTYWWSGQTVLPEILRPDLRAITEVRIRGLLTEVTS